MSKAWKKVAEDAYEGLTSCSGFRNECADGSSCYTDAGDYYTNEIAGARLIGKGFLKGAGDVAGGIIGLILSLLVLRGALYVLVRLLQSLVMGQAKKVIMKGTKMNDYLAMLLGLVITIIVQSSSVTTSALTPLVGIGLLPMHKMLPMTLGANIGATCTSILAAFAVMKFNSIQIAFCHLLFNIIGILILVPSASDVQGDCESCLHSRLLCLILALGAPHLHPGDVRRCARRFFGHFSSLWGQCSCRCRAHNSGSGCSGRIYVLVGAPGWLLQGCKPGGAGCPQG